LSQPLFSPVNTPPAFELTSSVAVDILLLEVAGEIDMATAPRLAEAMALAQDRARRVVVNLSEVTFLDSSALNALVHARRSLADRGLELRVVSPADRVVRRVFEITRLTEPLNVVDSLDEALA